MELIWCLNNYLIIAPNWVNSFGNMCAFEAFDFHRDEVYCKLKQAFHWLVSISSGTMTIFELILEFQSCLSSTMRENISIYRNHILMWEIWRFFTYFCFLPSLAHIASFTHERKFLSDFYRKNKTFPITVVNLSR